MNFSPAPQMNFSPIPQLPTNFQVVQPQIVTASPGAFPQLNIPNVRNFSAFKLLGMVILYIIQYLYRNRHKNASYRLKLQK